MTLREYLTVHELKPSAFALKAGLPVSTITRIVNGERRPGLDVMRTVWRATNGLVEPNDFLEELTIERFDALVDDDSEIAVTEPLA